MPECTIALVIGHRKGSQGAYNAKHDLTEWMFNREVATRVQAEVPECVIIHRHTYSVLPAQINVWDPKVVVSLHCNAYNTKAHGTETLYYDGSAKGQRLALIFQRHVVDALGLTDRGVKPKTSDDRGGYMLAETKAPAIICEPFFIDNNAELEAVLRDNKDALVNAYIAACREVLASDLVS